MLGQRGTAMGMFDIPIMVIKDAISEANLAGMETEEHTCRAALAVLEAADQLNKDSVLATFSRMAETCDGSIDTNDIEAISLLLACLPDMSAKPCQQAGKEGQAGGTI